MMPVLPVKRLTFVIPFCQDKRVVIPNFTAREQIRVDANDTWRGNANDRAQSSQVRMSSRAPAQVYCGLLPGN
jgi:hypothetical protein